MDRRHLSEALRNDGKGVADSADKKLGDYTILERIAQGGMAEVYKARTADPLGIERLVVIKRILPHIATNPEYVEMLIDEAKIAVNFTHGNIAQIYDLGRAGDDYFIVMEYVDGKTVGQIARAFKQNGRDIPFALIAHMGIEIARGLAYLHRKTDAAGHGLGVVHRDISPQNIIVSYSGMVKIIDFGVAKAEEKLGHTESGVLKGKFAYMSPEQAAGDAIDHQSDIFSLGTLLWELTTGRRLFKKKTNPETVKAVKRAHVRPPSRYRRDVPKELERIILTALKKSRRGRYASADALARDLERFLMQINPDFRLLHVAEILYKTFGPEADEAGLEPEFPQFRKEEIKTARRLVGKSDEEEDTAIDRRRPLLTLAGIVAAVVLVGGLVVMLVPYLFKGTLVLVVDPPDATVTVDGFLLEPVNNEDTYIIERQGSPAVRVRVEREGYEPFAGEIGVTSRRTVRKEMVLTEIVASFGDLLVETVPPGATVYIDNQEWPHKTPTVIPRLRSRESYLIGVYLEGTLYREEEILIEGGSKKTLKLELAGAILEGDDVH